METHNWSRFWRQKCVDFLHTKWFMQNGYEIKNVYYSTNFVAAASVAGAAGSNKMKWWWQMDAINVKWARRKAPIKTGLFDTPFAIVHARVHVHASSPYSICECTNYIFITLTIMKSFSFFCIYNDSVWMWNVPFSPLPVSENCWQNAKNMTFFLFVTLRDYCQWYKKSDVLFSVPIYLMHTSKTRKLCVCVSFSTKRMFLESRRRGGGTKSTHIAQFYLSRWKWLKAKVAEMLKWPDNKSLSHPFRSMHLIDLCVVLPLLISTFLLNDKNGKIGFLCEECDRKRNSFRMKCESQRQFIWMSCSGVDSRKWHCLACHLSRSVELSFFFFRSLV